MRGRQILDRLKLDSFRPLKPFESGPSQTIAASLFPQRPEERPVAFHEVRLPDGDILSVAENRPGSWREGEPIVALFHGLSGTYRSKYMIRYARKLQTLGILAYRINHRGCGSGFGLARRTYHSGRSEDAIAILKWLETRHPDSPTVIVGFSLGGNVVLKSAGELADSGPSTFSGVVAISAPADLAACVRKLRRPEGVFFDRFFGRVLTAEIQRRHLHYEDLGPHGLPRGVRLTEFDDLYTAPQNGFRDGADYWARASSAPLLKRIARPGLILCAEDDPIVDAQPYKDLLGPSPLDIVVTSRGGHVAHLGRDGRNFGFRWMDELGLRWIVEHFDARR